MNESTISNGIQTRQNEEGNVAKLAAADRLYSEVKRMSFFKFLIAVIFPFALSWIQLFWDNSLITSVSCVLAVISMLLSYRLTPAIQRKVTLAADIKQDYDVSVYQMPWNPALFGTRKNLAREIAENNAAGRNRNENNKFRDWYRPEQTVCPLKREFSRVRKRITRGTPIFANATEICARRESGRLFL